MGEYIDYIKLPMQENDAGAKTIGEYFEKLLLTLWDESECFSGKRPFGNSGWEYEIYSALVSAGVIDGKFDNEGYIEQCDNSAGFRIVREIIKSIFTPTAEVAPMAEVAREIFAEINQVKQEYAKGDIDGNELYVRLYLIEKKYTEGENDR